MRSSKRKNNAKGCLILRKVLSVLFALSLALSFTSPALAFDDKDCSDFSTWEEAQRFYEENGGPERDPHRLDGADNDGLVCENLKGFNENHVPGSFVDNGDSGSDSGNQGGQLPKTATFHPTMVLIGSGILAAGAGLLLYRRRHMA